MSFVVQLMEWFDNFIESNADPETKSWPGLESASRSVLIILFYVIFVTYLGPKFMASRKPYKLKKVILFYNIFQVISCTILFVWGSKIGPSWTCQPVHTLTPEVHLQAGKLCWWVLLLKWAELIETVFFVLRKKQNQVSALHVYHHASTLIIVWGTTKLFPSTMAVMPMVINCFVHMLMYTYYLLSAIGPEVQQKMAKWKKYITITQMIQFCLLITYALQILSPYCEVPNAYAYIFVPNVFLVFYLFYQFYKQSYSNKDRIKT